MKFSTFAAATTLGLFGASGALDDVDDDVERLAAGSIITAGIAGYLMGPIYPRRARYTVTAGDVRLLPIGGLLGVLVGATPFVDSDQEEIAFAAATVGGLAGIWLADRGWARPYDHGSGDVTQTWLGTIAGGLLGGALVVLTEADPTPAMAMVTLGAIAGTFGGHALAAPQRVGARQARSDAGVRGSSRGRMEFSVNPAALFGAAAGVRGIHPALTLRF
jgi:hypothetical protein